MDQKSPEISSVVKAAIEHHGSTRDALIPILSEVNQAFGYIPPEAFGEIKKAVNSPANDVFVSEGQLFSVASFYHMLSTKPLGRHVIRFCESAPCHVVGGREVIQAIINTLDLQPGDTTPDKKWSLITTSCIGACSVGPVILIDDDIYGNLHADQIPEILAKYN
jgi:NADH:ubiquinone oxidoreductase subunit E